MAELRFLLSDYRRAAEKLKKAISEEKIEEIELLIAEVTELDQKISKHEKLPAREKPAAEEILIAEQCELLMQENITVLTAWMQSRFEKWRELSGAIQALKEYQQKRGNSSYFIDHQG